MFSVDGVKKRFYVHRLVAEAFIPNPDNLPEVNHLNEDKTKNCISNLEWCNRKYNINYGSRNEKQGRARGKSVICIETGEEYYSAREAARQLNIPQTGITNCCLGKLKTTHNLHFKYKEV